MGNSRFVGEYYYQDGLRLPSYHNGQLLTADELKAEQEATWERLALLGRAAGAGVIEGLEVVRASTYQVFVRPGLGINSAGDIVQLQGSGVTLTINVQQSPGTTSTNGGKFRDCALNTSSGQPISEGAYLLTAVPTSKSDGSVPLKASPVKSNLPACASQWELEGVQFKAIRLEGVNLVQAITNRRRNLLAHWCLGTTPLKTMPHRPFDFPLKYTGLDLLDVADLTSCDLPLAVLYWTAHGIAFVDAWSARRRLVLSYPSSQWEMMVSDRRVAQGQAVFLQFQEQLNTFSNMTVVVAEQNFRYLPPVCFLPAKPPIYVVQYLARILIEAYIQLTSRAPAVSDSQVNQFVEEIQKAFDASPNYGITLSTFFGNLLPNRIGLIERELVETRLNDSWHDEPIDLDVLPRFDLHIVAENVLLYIAAVLLQVLFRQLDQSRTAALEKGVDVSQLSPKLQQWWFLVRTLIVQALTSLIRLDPALIEAAISTPDINLLYVVVVKRIDEVNYIETAQTAPPPIGSTPPVAEAPIGPVGVVMRPTAPTEFIGGQPSAAATPSAVVDMANNLLVEAANPNLAFENPQNWATLNTLGLIRAESAADTPPPSTGGGRKRPSRKP
jgi:hypothetical protein